MVPGNRSSSSTTEGVGETEDKMVTEGTGVFDRVGVGLMGVGLGVVLSLGDGTGDGLTGVGLGLVLSLGDGTGTVGTVFFS